MSTRFQAVIFLIGTLGLSGVALAQQLRGPGGQDAASAAVVKDAEQGRVRVTRPVLLRYADTGCAPGICAEPPKRAEQAQAVPVADGCSSLGTAHDRNGRTIRRLCAFN